MSSDNWVRIPVVAGFVVLCGANIVGNIISAEKRCNYLGRSRVTRLVVLYKPLPSPNNGLTHNLFITEFTDYLELHIATTKQLVLLGDFNIHINKTDDRDAVEFNNLLDQFGLVQHVGDATHRGGHTLDLVLSRSQLGHSCTGHPC